MFFGVVYLKSSFFFFSTWIQIGASRGEKQHFKNVKWGFQEEGLWLLLSFWRKISMRGCSEWAQVEFCDGKHLGSGLQKHKGPRVITYNRHTLHLHQAWERTWQQQWRRAGDGGGSSGTRRWSPASVLCRPPLRWGQRWQSHQRTPAGGSSPCRVWSLQCRGRTGSEPDPLPGEPPSCR